MRNALIAVMFSFVGCIEVGPPPVVSTTAIPGTPFSVELVGPDMKHHYSCYVITEDSRSARRFLGPIPETELDVTKVETLEGGQVRIQWGTSDIAGFCVIDADDELFIEDSNMANPTGVPFDLQSTGEAD